MTFEMTPGAIKKFKRTPWRFQRTVETPPLKDLERFVSVILGANPCERAKVTIDDYVFEPKMVNALIGNASGGIRHDLAIEATGREVGRLLVACFSDWVDFLFVPTPKPFVIYADHDEYATFYAISKSNLNLVTEPIRKAGFTLVEDWTREF
jgi:hypothetical protein